MSREVFKIHDTTGTTRFLSLSVNASALYSLDGVSWVPLVTHGESGENPPAEYSFGYGLSVVGDTVTVDPTTVVTLSNGKIPLRFLPDMPIAYGDGLVVTAAGVLKVDDPNTPGHIVVVPPTGKLPDSILPDKPNILQEYSNGITVLSDLSLTVTDADVASRLVVLGTDGKIPSSAISGYPTGFGAGLGIDTTGQLTVVESNAAGRIVVLPDTGVIPPAILPPAEAVEYGEGIKVSESGVVSVDIGTTAGKIPALSESGTIPPTTLPIGNGLVIDTNRMSVDIGTAPGKIPAVGSDGKLPSAIIPITDEPIEYVGGTGIEVTGNVISEIWKDYT